MDEPRNPMPETPDRDRDERLEREALADYYESQEG